MPTADIIFKNANVVTIDQNQPVAELVAVKNGKILFVGFKEQLSEFTGPSTNFIDCGGKTLIPGFNDAHCHIFSFIRKLTSIDLSPPKIKSIDNIKAVIRDKVKNTPPGQWITGTDYNDFYLAEKRHPTRWEIDEVAPDNPVILSHRSLHGCVLNSKALALAGITIETPEPTGVMIGRDVDRGGEPNGFLVEMLGYIREKVMPPISNEELDSGIKLANEQFLSQGLTSLQDATIVNDLKRWYHFQHFKEQGLLKSRVYMMTGIDTMKDFQDAGLFFTDGDDNLRLGAVKIVPSMILDELHPSQEELNAMVLLVHNAGFQVAIHGIQSTMVDAIIRSYEYLQKQTTNFSIRRHRIEHCAECPPALMKRIQKLHPVITTHPSFTYYSGDRYLATVSKDVIPWLYRIGTMVKSGLIVAGASDSPIVSNNPLMGIYGGASRVTSSGQFLNQDECLTANQLLRLYTINAAYASHEENIKGSITPGKLADMVLLSDDPTKITAEKIKDIKVQMTVIDGKVVWEG
jgi:predicted amidohydrolase YtcJ